MAADLKASEDPQPNATTRAAMAGPTEGLPRFSNLESLKADLDSPCEEKLRDGPN
jgi:hypothetical protein